ncbi:NTP transferase domain-containing protein [Pseudahrensia aquimaris]|uniref:NTP transferase domain-containing protein n=1 Tax=Pseudahrensia aquimaris TaxID=744461 RepID=A0ABW3FIQ4_9HYPH
MSEVSGVILAAGTSSRMGVENKLMRVWRGKPLVRHVYDAAVASDLAVVVSVTGHEADLVASCLPGDAAMTCNGDYANGMAGSIRAGLYRLQGHGPVMILLGDMPLVTTHHINAMLDAFQAAASDNAIVVATHEGKIGNPVIFGKEHFAALKLLEGDRGAGELVRNSADTLIKVEIGPAASQDFDTPDAFSN